jgi:xanthosine utilization system XapX-like protein
MNLISLLAGAVFGFITYLVLIAIGIPAPWPTIGGLIVFAFVFFGGDRFGRHWS